MHDTDDRILDAALRLFQETGLHGATTRRIAEEAGVNEVTLFRRFGSKEHLLHEAISRGVQQEGFTPLPKQPEDPEVELIRWVAEHMAALRRMRQVLRKAIGEFEAHPQLCASTRTGPYQAADELYGYLSRLRQSALAPGDWDPHAATALLMGVVFNDAMHRDVMPDMYPYPVEVAPQRYVGLFLRALGVSTDRRET